MSQVKEYDDAIESSQKKMAHGLRHYPFPYAILYL